MAYKYLLTILGGPDTGTEIPLEKPDLLLGREATNDVIINDPEVSRRHARLKLIENQYMIEDLGSTNGTFLQGKRIAIPLALHPGDVIKIGERVLLRYDVTQFDPDATMLSPRHEIPVAATPMPEPVQRPVAPIVEKPIEQAAPQVAPQPAPPPIAPVTPASAPVQTPRPAAVPPAAASQAYSGKVPQQPSAGKKKSKWLVILLIVLIVVIVFCVIPWIIIDITNSYCLFMPGIFNALQPGVCP